MSKRNRRAPVAPAADLGPAIRHQRGELITEFRPDPDNPQRGTVRGAKTRVWYHVAWIEGVLTDEQHEAADRYLVRLEQADGAQEGSPARVAGVGGQGYAGPTERQVMVLADIRQANEVLGAEAQIVRQTVGFNLTPPGWDWDKSNHDWDTLRPFVTDIRAALQRLADYWGM